MTTDLQEIFEATLHLRCNALREEMQQHVAHMDHSAEQLRQVVRMLESTVGKLQRRVVMLEETVNV